MIDLKLNKKRLAMHWHYYAWRYAVCVIAALAAANFLFSATAPKAPPEKRVDVIIIGDSFTSDITDVWGNEILRMLPPDQQEANVTTTALIEGQEGTIYQLIGARMAAGEGNVWILPKDLYQSFASSGAFRYLDGDISSFDIPEGTDLNAGRVIVQLDENSTGENHLCGIPLDKCTGLAELFFPANMVMAFPSYSTSNVENTIAAANWMLTKTNEPKVLSSLKPAEKVEISVLAHSFRTANADAWQDEIKKALDSSKQEVSVSLDTYHVGRESFSANMIAEDIRKGLGTAWIIPGDVFSALAKAGVLRALDGELKSFAIPEGTDLATGRAAAVVNGKAGEALQYGIPLDKCAALAKVTVPDGMLLVFPQWRSYDFNYDNAKKAINWILATDLAPEKVKTGTDK